LVVGKTSRKPTKGSQLIATETYVEGGRLMNYYHTVMMFDVMMIRRRRIIIIIIPTTSEIHTG